MIARAGSVFLQLETSRGIRSIALGIVVHEKH
jgi:hypothetical protein